MLLAVSRQGATVDDAARLRQLIETHLDTPVTPIAASRAAEPPHEGEPLPDVAAAPAGLLVREHTPRGGTAA